MPEGRQSPSPEGQSGRQLQDPTGSGKGGLGKTEYKDPKSQLDVSPSYDTQVYNTDTIVEPRVEPQAHHRGYPKRKIRQGFQEGVISCCRAHVAPMWLEC